MIVCPSIAPASEEEAKANLRKLRGRSSWAELRIDRLPEKRIGSILNSPRPSVIVTNRRRSEGGAFDGDAGEQLAILEAAHRDGAEMVDIEIGWGNRVLECLFERVPRRKVLLSHHLFGPPSPALFRTYTTMKEYDAAVMKIAFMARDIADTEIVFRLLRMAAADRIRLVAIAMGDRGEVSRIIGSKFGSYLTYTSPGTEPATGPGQLSQVLLETVYRVAEIDRRTEVFGLIGNPVSRSRGIYYHNDEFRRRRKNAVYVNFLVDHLDRFMEVYSGILRGASVTMPFKNAILQYLDVIDEDASAVEAVNTVVRKGGRFHGCNTDLPAVLGVLKAHTALRGKQALVLGTGAMAGTMVFALLQAGAFPVIAGRSAHKAEALARRFGCPWVPYGSRTEIDVDIVLNATSIGMPGSEKTVLLPPSFFRPRMVVLDATQSEQPTLLVVAAKRHGCDVITGNEIFRAQAALQARQFLSVLR